MNDKEFAELLSRERHARSLGYRRNDYVCAICSQTFLNWPTHYDARTLRAYCDLDAPAVLDIVPLQEHERVNR